VLGNLRSCHAARIAQRRAIMWELLMLALVINVPFMQDAFGTTSRAPQEWLLVAGLALLSV
jgi:hypothetical protein